MTKKEAELLVQTIYHLAIFESGATSDEMQRDFYKEYQAFKKKNPVVQEVMHGLAYGMTFDDAVKLVTKR